MPPPMAPEPLPILSSLACSLQSPPVFLGRAQAAPRVKLMEDPYQRPELQFFPLRKGPRAAGELIATFELIELDYRGQLEVRVPWPSCHELWIPLVILSGCPPQGIYNMASSRVTPNLLSQENAGCQSVLGLPH